MTDASTGLGPGIELPVPVRIGAWVELVDGELIGRLRVHPAIVHRGVVDPTALAALVDMLGGLSCDDDADHWVFTSNLSVRSAPVPAPDELRCTVRVLRSGARSSTTQIALRSADGVELGAGFATFSRVPRRPTDLPKPVFDLATMGDTWSQIEVLDRAVRDAAGVRVVDAATGHVEIDVQPSVCNPAGAVHGAMLGMLVQVAAEELSDAIVGGRHVAADLDLRYLSQARSGPVATRARFVGDPADLSVVVDVLDLGDGGRLAVVATARCYPAPS